MMLALVFSMLEMLSALGMNQLDTFGFEFTADDEAAIAALLDPDVCSAAGEDGKATLSGKFRYLKELLSYIMFLFI